jgi:hypothetical protein
MKTKRMSWVDQKKFLQLRVCIREDKDVESLRAFFDEHLAQVAAVIQDANTRYLGDDFVVRSVRVGRKDEVQIATFEGIGKPRRPWYKPVLVSTVGSRFAYLEKDAWFQARTKAWEMQKDVFANISELLAPLNLSSEELWLLHYVQTEDEKPQRPAEIVKSRRTKKKAWRKKRP